MLELFFQRFLEIAEKSDSTKVASIAIANNAPLINRNVKKNAQLDNFYDVIFSKEMNVKFNYFQFR